MYKSDFNSFQVESKLYIVIAKKIFQEVFDRKVYNNLIIKCCDGRNPSKVCI